MLIWLNGKIIDEKDFYISPLSPTLHYGTGVFEGIRAYEQRKNVAGIFRLKEHAKRLVYSSKILVGKKVLEEKEIEKAVIETLKANKVTEAYIRPLFFLSGGQIGLENIEKSKPSLLVAVVNYPPFLDKKPIKVKISSYRKIPSICQPQNAKLSANYVNSILATREAKEAGYDEALLLNIHGKISEGAGENIFLVKDEIIYTPPVSEDLLEGITRNSVIKIADYLGIKVIEKPLSIADLFNADELFFTGTAAEIVPIGNVNGFVISEKIGKITKKIMETFDKIKRGKIKDFSHWITEVEISH